MKNINHKLAVVAILALSFFIAANSRAQTPPPQGSPPGARVTSLPKGIQGLEEGQKEQPPGTNWLLGAKDDEERFRRLQIYSGGTEQQMWQIGYRYQQTYQAIIGEHWELARHHWFKLRNVFNIALMKRPNRTPNAEAMFLDTNWQLLADAIDSKDGKQVRESFQQARSACMACHVAEQYGFINDTPLFAETASFSGN